MTLLSTEDRWKQLQCSQSAVAFTGLLANTAVRQYTTVHLWPAYLEPEGHNALNCSPESRPAS